jgi:hypothetical protein
MCEEAGGKLPSWRCSLGSYSSDSGPTSFAQREQSRKRSLRILLPVEQEKRRQARSYRRGTPTLAVARAYLGWDRYVGATGAKAEQVFAAAKHQIGK